MAKTAEGLPDSTANALSPEHIPARRSCLEVHRSQCWKAEKPLDSADSSAWGGSRTKFPAPARYVPQTYNYPCS